MDTSRSYVKMCRNAQELQTSWIPEKGDWWHIGAKDNYAQIDDIIINGEKKWTDGEKNYYLPYDIDLYGIIWLPRQDQLQKMSGFMIEGKNISKHINSIINDFCEHYNTEENLTFEKMWLMYYMAKNYKKIWKEGRWVKQKISLISQ